MTPFEAGGHVVDLIHLLAVLYSGINYYYYLFLSIYQPLLVLFANKL